MHFGRRRRGLMLVVSSPSGTGKTTLCHMLLREHCNLSFSVSYTTRPLRGCEQDGVDYWFISDEQFDRMVAEDRFAEWARVHRRRYGTSVQTVEAALGQGRDLIFDIDYQGGLQLADRYPDDTVLVFILPPSFVELERRLRGRGTDSDDVVAHRLEAAREELEFAREYHYLILNDDLSRAYDALRSVYRAALVARGRQDGVLRGLLEGWNPAPGAAS